ncbi:MAG TPA: hypothetical protein VKE24_14215 [Candidatus Acidoferrales bacterium]|nr:hypothetical protein [Candidatus Acidoferrales bacterium]
MKNRAPASTHKKVIVQLADGTPLRGYLNPAALGESETLDVLTPDGAHESVALENVRGVYFVREFTDHIESERKTFLSRPKLDGLWVRLRFRDSETIEGVVPNDLLAFLDHGVQVTPPDLHGNTLRIFIPRTALAEMTVLGVVGIARRKPARVAPASQPKLFNE